MRIGYARVSTLERSLGLQVEALEHAGCEWIYIDVDNHADAEREGLIEALTVANPGDVLIVWKLDRVGRSIQHLFDLVTHLQRRQIGFRSLREQLDTNTHGGRWIMRVLGALAEFETDTSSGPELRRRGGRPRALDEKGIALARRLFEDGHTPPSAICRILGISRATLYRHVSSKRTRLAHDSSPAGESGS